MSDNNEEPSTTNSLAWDALLQTGITNQLFVLLVEKGVISADEGKKILDNIRGFFRSRLSGEGAEAEEILERLLQNMAGLESRLIADEPEPLTITEVIKIEIKGGEKDDDGDDWPGILTRDDD